MFKNDFAWDKTSPYQQNLVLSPDYSRAKFETLFSSAKSSIQMYFQYFQDKVLESVFLEQSKKGVQISSIVSSNYAEDYPEKINDFQKQWIQMKYMKKPKMHAKAILIDKKYLFIGSVNFSSYSLDSNREVWILIKNPEIISQFLQIFETDFSQAQDINKEL